MKQKNITKPQARSENDQKKQSMLEKFFTAQLKDIYYAEQQLMKALAEMKMQLLQKNLKMRLKITVNKLRGIFNALKKYSR